MLQDLAARVSSSVRDADAAIAAARRYLQAQQDVRVREVRSLIAMVQSGREDAEGRGWADVVATCDGLLSDFVAIEQLLGQGFSADVVDKVNPRYASANELLSELAQQLQSRRTES